MVEEIARIELPNTTEQDLEVQPVDPLTDANLKANCQSTETVAIEFGDNDIADAAEVMVCPAEKLADAPVPVEKQPTAVVKAAPPKPSAPAIETPAPRLQEEAEKVEAPQVASPKTETGKTAVAQVVEVPQIVEKKADDSKPAAKKEIFAGREMLSPAKKVSEEASEDPPEPEDASDGGGDGNGNEHPTPAAESPEPEKPPRPPLLTKEDLVFKGEELPQYPQFPNMILPALNEHCQEIHGNEVVEPPELQAQRESINEGICWLGEDIGIDLSKKVPTAAQMRYYENVEEHNAALEAAGAVEAGSKGRAIQRLNSIYMTLSDDTRLNGVVLSHEAIHQTAAQIITLRHMEVQANGELRYHADVHNGYVLPGNALKELVADLAGVDALIRSGSLEYLYSYFSLDVFGAALLERVAETQGTSMKEVYHGLLRDMINGSEEEGIAMLRASLSEEEFDLLAHMDSYDDVSAMAHRLGLSGVEEEIQQSHPARWYFGGYYD
jgi:hypothetical protein